jgi:pimeloyl-ACP methyl ester carboxylesterase
MKRWEIVLAAVGAFLLALSAWAMHLDEVPHRDAIVTAGTCHMPVMILDPTTKPTGSAIVFHGLAADRLIMLALGEHLVRDTHMRVYLFDLAGHGKNTDAFSFARVDSCAREVVASMVRSGEIDPKQTIVIGHSMGGAIAIRMADPAPMAGTIAISPAPTPMPRRMPANLLIFSAQFDLPMLRGAALELQKAAGGERTSSGDFAEARAFHLQITTWSDHVSLLTNRDVLRQIGIWSRAVLESAKNREAGLVDWNGEISDNELLYVDAFSFEAKLRRMTWNWPTFAPGAGLLGLFFMFPLAASIVGRLGGRTETASSNVTPSFKLVLIEGVFSAFVAILILVAFVPLAFVRLYTGDYLASLMLIAGGLLIALNWKAAKQAVALKPRTVIAAAALGLAAILCVGAWLAWQTADLWLNAPRWWRFAALVPIAWIFCFAEETVLGPIGSGRGRIWRFALFLAIRSELWLACLFAYFLLASSQVLILILVVTLLLFSILQRFATDALRLRTGSPAAAALFGAILAAWFVAAVFPLT